ncbi:MAG: hypothetical protein ACK4E7_04085 [Permianibacter sp.]
MLLLLKLTLVPTLILLVSLAGARWGARVAGLLAGFPIIVGPILLFLTLAHGPTFAAQAALSTLYGLLALIGYCLSFSWLARRWPWWLCLPAGWLVFLAIASASLAFFIGDTLLADAGFYAPFSNYFTDPWDGGFLNADNVAAGWVPVGATGVNSIHLRITTRAVPVPAPLALLALGGLLLLAARRRR